jgi:hypothetical protein
MSRPVAAGALLCLLLAGCRHTTQTAPPAVVEKPPEPVVEGRAALGRVLGSLGCLPTCELTEDVVPAEKVANGRGGGGVRKIRGRFDLGAAACTQRACSGACCNGCRGFWSLVGTPKGKDQLLLVSRHEKLPRRWGGMDCGVPFMRENLPAVDLIVTGRVQPPVPAANRRSTGYADATVKYSSICVVRETKDGAFPAECSAEFP